MRIVHVTDRRFPPCADEGGAPQSLLSLYEEQRRQGHDVWGATSRGSDGADIWSLGANGSRLLSLLAKIRDYAVDVVHFHAYAAEMQAELHAAGIASVTHVHGTHAGGTPAEVNPIYVSRRHADIHGGEVYVHNGIAVGDLALQSGAQDYIAFLGKVRRSKKGADLAVSVAKRTQRQLMLVGGRKFSVPETWLPFQRWVRALGVLAGDEKFAVLRNASALLFPIRWEEPFGLKGQGDAYYQVQPHRRQRRPHRGSH